MEASDVFAIAMVGAMVLLIFVSVAFLVSGLDDLFIDVCYFCRAIYRRLFVERLRVPVTEAALLARPQQPIAVMVPAWDESAVIRPMLLNMVRSLNYDAYHVFVGTYPNDEATHREVDAVCAVHPHVHRVVTPHDGPTNKADCLNWILQGVKRVEREQGIHFEIFVMQDCEDVIHPLCYRVFNLLIPRHDMVQVPVLSLLPKWHQLTAGHYIDEFSQLHYKDLVVRELLNGSLPAAGVGCAFSRRGFDTIAAQNNNIVFSVDSLTEDYEFGFRMKQYGLKQIFAQVWVQEQRELAAFPSPNLVCVREFFPSKFRAAVRQKSRWVLGITLQGWENLGWLRGAATRYMLVRDRKGLLTNLVNVLAYFVVFAVVGMLLMNHFQPDSYRYPALLEKGAWLWYVILGNGVLLCHRAAMRAYCVYRIYGTQQALLSLPRMVWGNFINFLATARAIKQYARYLRTGKLIAWDKTQHVYPSEEQLGGTARPRLGEVLLQRQLITPDQLNDALARQRERPSALGQILKEMGAIQDAELSHALGAR